MGYAKVVKQSDRKVKIVHQLNDDGTPYAENVTIELQEGVDASRLEYLTSMDGRVGILSYSFRAEENTPSVKFPE